MTVAERERNQVPEVNFRAGCPHVAGQVVRIVRAIPAQGDDESFNERADAEKRKGRHG